MTQARSDEFDYVIVGAGSAGCVLANRLSADPASRVCLIEAGPSGRSLGVRLLVNIPAGIFSLIANPRYNWMYKYDSGPGPGNRPIFCPRGRIVGGTSAINGMVYMRGNRLDYDRWKAAGCDGWGYSDVLPYFKRSEHCERGASEFHGTGGELNVAGLRDPHPVCDRLVAAAEQLQYRRNDDFNGAEQDGFGHYQVTQKNGERWSSARAFLDPVRNRPNLAIVADALVERVVLEGRRATGVTIRRDGQSKTIGARREVVVSAGAINSPQLLLLSGIGPAAELRRHGLAIEHELAGVGENLQDHQDIVACWSSPNPKLYGLSMRALPWMLASPFQFLFARRGALTTNTAEGGGFFRTTPDKAQPDVQLHLLPMYVNQPQHLIPRGHGFSIHICVLQPKSRGRLTLNSAKPQDAPKLSANFLDHPDDLQSLSLGFKRVRQMVESSAFDDMRGAEILPGPGVKTDAQIEDFIRATVATVFHPVGTCKMGVDAMAVVDPQLRVRGLGGLRVIDASIMPELISGNTNAPTIMIAEKGAEMIRTQNAI